MDQEGAGIPPAHRGAEERLLLLAEASGSLLGNPDLTVVLPTILDLSRRLIAAEAYAVWRRDPSTGDWRVLADLNLSAEYPRVILGSPRAMPDQPLVVEDVTQEPFLVERLAGYRMDGIRSLLCVPLCIHGENSGTIAFYYHQRQRFDETNLRVAMALGNLAASAITSAELYDEQRRMRAAAEAAQQRLSFLAEASRILASSLDYDTTLEHLARLAVPDVADWCSITIVEEDGTVRPLAVAHVDPEKVERAREWQRRYPYDPDAERGPAHVLRTGVPELYAEITDEMLVGAARDEEHLATLRELGMASVMLVPLVARDRTLGLISFVAAESGIHFGEADLALAQDLASRAAIAIDNARLYREAQVRAATLHSFFEGAPLMMGIADVIGDDILHISDNPLTEEFFGLSPGSTCNRLASEMGVPAAHIRLWVTHYREAARTEGVVRFEYEHHTPAGARHLSASVATIGRMTKDRLRCCYVVEDVTERRQSEMAVREAEERLRLAVDLAEIGTWDFNPVSGALNWSDRCKAMFGLSPDSDVDYEVFLSRLHPEDRERSHRAVQKALNPGGPGEYRIEYRSRWPDGTVRWIVARGRSVFAGTGQDRHAERFIGTVLDVTERRLLEDQLRERVAELGEMARRKDDYLSMLAHELRNPLGAMSNALQVMKIAPPGTSAFTRAQASAGRQLEHQTRLVNDLLDVARINHGRLHLERERLDLVHLIRQAVEDHRSRLEAAGLSLSIDLPKEAVPVAGDRTRLSQVLANLLDNAVKFTPPGGEVLVRMEIGPGNAAVTTTVRDTGVGIEPDLLPRIFDPLIQADRTLNRSQGGLGLGLALVKGLTELHGGTVYADSKGPGSGAEFIFTLPVESELSALKDMPYSLRPSSERLRVLIVEDNRDAAETLGDLLGLLGYDVELASTGHDALLAARQRQPHVVLCDIGLPGMDGYQVAAELRRDPITSGAHLIAVTGYGGESDQRRSTEVGFDAHVTKPVNPEMLQRLLESHRNGKR